MNWLKAVWTEVFGLFVDDGMFAIAILAWLALVWLLVRYSGMPAWVSALTLLVGLSAILLESATRYARKRARSVKSVV